VQIRILIPLLAVSTAAFADFRPLDTKCTAGNPGCFAEVAKTTAPCKEILRRRASSTRGETVADWKRCPVSGFRTVHAVDYVVVTDPQGGVWAFTNFVDPTQAVVKDFRFLSKRIFYLETAATRDPGRRYCFLDLSAEQPSCMSPPLPELEEKVQALLEPNETLCCSDWQLTDLTAKRVSATRPIFRDKRQVGSVSATLKLSPPEVTVDRVQRSE
jgi:hypothetical protein